MKKVIQKIETVQPDLRKTIEDRLGITIMKLKQLHQRSTILLYASIAVIILSFAIPSLMDLAPPLKAFCVGMFVCGAMCLFVSRWMDPLINENLYSPKLHYRLATTGESMAFLEDATGMGPDLWKLETPLIQEMADSHLKKLIETSAIERRHFIHAHARLRILNMASHEKEDYGFVP